MDSYTLLPGRHGLAFQELTRRKDLCRPLTEAAEDLLPGPLCTRPGVSCDRLTYLCKLTQSVLQHFHSEDEGALCQDLTVSISQIFPAVIQRDRNIGTVSEVI